jgi:S1/P1 nuclease
MTRLTLLIVALLPTPALAWNRLGHTVVAEIAWQKLSPSERQPIVDALRRHPAFDKDFAGKMADDVAGADEATQDHWIFQQAATWPDIARKTEYDRPSWHYIDVPFFLDGKRSVPFNLSTDYPTTIDSKDYNVA